jgi:uridine kinase
MACIVGVAGGSGAGKTTLVRALVDRLGGCILDLDSYYIDRAGIAVGDRGRLNYDDPAAIDVELLREHLDLLAHGRPIAKPVYSFDTHTRVGTRLMTAGRLVIVEGLFTWWWELIRQHLVLKLFVDAPADVRLVRRIRRDVAERGRTMEQVVQQYLATVRPMHERYVEPCRAFADVVIGNDGGSEAAAERAARVVRQVIAAGIEHGITTSATKLRP